MSLLQSHECKPKESTKGKEDSTKAKMEKVADYKEVGETKAEEGKTKAELRAERRAKQEAQRAAKAVAVDHKLDAKAITGVTKVKTDKPVGDAVKVKGINILK